MLQEYDRNPSDYEENEINISIEEIELSADVTIAKKWVSLFFGL
jgi:hypothetical protein